MATHSGRARSDIEGETYERFPRLAERRSQLAGTMSGGEQQMLALARGLATDPALSLLDELSMGLAPLIVEELYAQVAEIAAHGVRSEEHTSELQSLMRISYAVFCLKKK